MKKITYLKDLYSFPGFRALARLKPHPEHPGAMVVTLKRRQKKRFVPAVSDTVDGMISANEWFATLVLAIQSSIWSLISAGFNATAATP